MSLVDNNQIPVGFQNVSFQLLVRCRSCVASTCVFCQGLAVYKFREADILHGDKEGIMIAWSLDKAF